MLEFTCPNCGERVQGDDSFAGKHVLCPGCHATIVASPLVQQGVSVVTAIATPEHTSTAKITPSADAIDGSFRAGEPPPVPRDVLPPIHKEVPRILLRYVQTLMLAVIVLVGVSVLVLWVQKVRATAARTRSTNNLKNIALAFHGFHDANRRIPFNGTVPAVAGDNNTGSWAFQILPYMDQNLLFTKNPLDTTVSVITYMCPARGRAALSTSGAWTDYFINTWLNDSLNGTVNAADVKRTLIEITDGTSCTIFVGHGAIDPTLYSSNEAIAQSGDIFTGGQAATARFLTTNQVDTPNVTALNWGSPFPQGALMGIGDATIRMFPYTSYSGGVITKGVST
jgi:hypothetical protein